MAAKPVCSARHIDAAAARVVARIAATQFVPGHNSVRRGRDIESRVHRECNDWCHPEAALLSADTENCMTISSPTIFCPDVPQPLRYFPDNHPTDLNQGFCDVLVPVSGLRMFEGLRAI